MIGCKRLKRQPTQPLQLGPYGVGMLRITGAILEAIGIYFAIAGHAQRTHTRPVLDAFLETLQLLRGLLCKPSPLGLDLELLECHRSPKITALVLLTKLCFRRRRPLSAVRIHYAHVTWLFS